MFEKSFVSLYFADNFLYILQLKSSGLKLVRMGEMEVPPGLIKENRVQDSKSLGTFLKEVWKKFHIKEKKVGIVIPEATTFIKLVKIPNIGISELNEAVMWQAQDVLPEGIEDMVVDWKITESSPSGYEVLIVATKKNLLSGFVESCEKAGLFPMLVETPSLALMKLSEGSKIPRLVIFRGRTEFIVVIGVDKKLVGSSIVQSTSKSDLIKTVMRMISHYKNEIEIKEVVVGGTNITEDVIQDLESQVKTRVVGLDKKVSGMKEDQVQSLLIPVLLQQQDMSEPSDPNTLNLLPGTLVDKYKRAQSRLRIWGALLTVTLFVWLSLLVSLGTYLFLSQGISDQKALGLGNSSVSERREKISADISFVNDTSLKVLKIKGVSVSPQKLLNDINSAKPNGIAFNEYDLDLDKGIVEIEGIADTRQSLITLKENLEKNPDVTSVEIPISSFEVETNLEFRLTLQIGKLSTKAPPGVKR